MFDPRQSKETVTERQLQHRLLQGTSIPALSGLKQTSQHSSLRIEGRESPAPLTVLLFVFSTVTLIIKNVSCSSL